jgi:phosphate:Na+ symporter
MIYDSIALLLGGLGLFFVGIRMVSSNLKLMTSRKLKLTIARLTDSGIAAGIWGTLFGFITQSSSATAFIVAGLNSSGLLSVRKSLPIILWSNAGCTALVLLAVIDIRDAVLILLGISGICYAFEQPKKFHHVLGALFGVSLLFLGLHMLSTGAAPIAETRWIRDLLLHTRHSYALTFLIGAVLALITQTAMGVIIIAVAMTKSGLFTFDQTLMIIYGAHVGASITDSILSMSLRGSPKQSAMAQVFFDGSAGIIFMLLLYVEIYTGIPLIKVLFGFLFKDIAQQAAFVVIFMNILVPTLLSFILDPFYRLLERFWPPLEEEALSKIKFIHEHTAGDPDTAVLLIEKEVHRLLQRIPLYLEKLRSDNNSDQGPSLESYHAAFAEVSAEIQAFTTDVFRQDLSLRTSEALINVQDRHNLVIALEDNCYRIVETMRETAASDGKAAGLAMNIAESLDAIILTAIDVTEDPDQSDLDILLSLTADRGQLMEKIRRSYLSSADGLGTEERSLILYVTNLFERSVWTLGRYGKLLEITGQTEANN